MGVKKQQEKRQIEIDLVGKWAPAGPHRVLGFSWRGVRDSAGRGRSRVCWLSIGN